MIKGYARGIAAAVRFGSAFRYQLQKHYDPLDRLTRTTSSAIAQGWTYNRLLSRQPRRAIVFWICLLVTVVNPGISFADDTSDPCGGTGYFQYYQIYEINNGYGCTPFACQVGEQTQSEQTAAAQCFNAAQFIHCTAGPQPSYFAQGPAGVQLFPWRDGFILNWQLSQYGSPAAYMRSVRMRAICSPTKEYFAQASSTPPSRADAGQPCPKCRNGLDPVNPSSGNETLSESDVEPVGSSDRLGFKRYYNSLDATNLDLGPGWRHSFSRHLTVASVSLNSSNTSSPYMAQSDACTSGRAQISTSLDSHDGAFLTAGA